MLTVAGVGAIICRNWKGPKLSEKTIIATLLVHDMANIIKYKFGKSDTYLFTPADRKKIGLWRNLKAEAIAKYGNDSEEAMNKMAQELNLDSKVISLLKKLSEVHTKGNELDGVFAKKDWELAICIYSDWRVSPKGIVSINSRLRDIFLRYSINEPTERRKILSTASELERWLSRNVKIKPNAINSGSVKRYISMFRSGKFSAS